MAIVLKQGLHRPKEPSKFTDYTRLLGIALKGGNLLGVRGWELGAGTTTINTPSA